MIDKDLTLKRLRTMVASALLCADITSSYLAQDVFIGYAEQEYKEKEGNWAGVERGAISL